MVGFAQAVENLCETCRATIENEDFGSLATEGEGDESDDVSCTVAARLCSTGMFELAKWVPATVFGIEFTIIQEALFTIISLPAHKGQNPRTISPHLRHRTKVVDFLALRTPMALSFPGLRHVELVDDRPASGGCGGCGGRQGYDEYLAQEMMILLIEVIRMYE